MEDTLAKSIFVFIGTVILAALVSIIMFTIMLGTSIQGSLVERATKYYSEAGLSIMIDANNLDSIDAPNLYKMLCVNSNVIIDWNIMNMDGEYIRDWEELLLTPTSKYSVTIRGDSAIGFEVQATEVERIEVN